MQKYILKQKEKIKSTDYLKQVEEHLKVLAKETDDMKKSEFFKKYLNTMSKFWKYSYHNQMLIHFQKTDATNIAGFRTWKEFGRNIIKGSKGIKILAFFSYSLRLEITKFSSEIKLTIFSLISFS